MSRHERYYQQRITPCPCGSSDPYWHDDKPGERLYLCDICWTNHKRAKNRARRALAKINREDVQAKACAADTNGAS